MDYWGRTGGLSIVLPYAFIDTAAGPFRASTNGVSDIGFLWQTGWTWAETYVTARFFTDNSSYLVNGAQTLSQKPILRLEEHLSRNLTDSLWLSLDAYYNVGGETRRRRAPSRSLGSAHFSLVKVLLWAQPQPRLGSGPANCGKAIFALARLALSPHNGRMATSKQKTKFVPVQLKAEPGWYVRITLPHGEDIHIDEFKTEAEARAWIVDKSPAWLRKYRGGRYA